jgi:hypothetical protein
MTKLFDSLPRIGSQLAPYFIAAFIHNRERYEYYKSM